VADRSRDLPSAFRRPGVVAALSTTSVATSLASLVYVTFAVMFHDDAFPQASALTTLAVAVAWMASFRIERTVGRRKLPLGFVLSLPLAALNAALAGGVLMQMHSFDVARFLGGMVFGVTFGALVWLPAWVVTLLVFGRPLVRARELAARGVAGREQGDGVVGRRGAFVAAASLLGLVLVAANHVAFPVALALLGLATGAAAALAARSRANARRAFVREVAEGRVPQFRVDATPEGDALVRVLAEGSGYRIADHEEALAWLDDEGVDVRRAR
jgi:hypothetical protein